MKPMNTRSACLLVVVAVIVAAAVYGAILAQRLKDRGAVAKMTATMKTVCVGRFLIDLPAGAAYYLNGAFVGGFRVSGTEESREQFVARVAAREAELDSEANEMGRKSLESVKPFDVNGFTGKAFVFDRSSSYTLDGKVRQDWIAVKLEGHVHGDGKSFAFVADGYDPARTDDLGKLIGQLRAVPAGTLPSVPGFCFGPGMLLDPISAAEAEKIVLFAGLPGHPDVRITLNTMAGLKRTWPGLLERRAHADAEQPAWVRARFTALRSGPRTIHGLAGAEAVMKVMERNFSLVYGLDWELPGREDDVLEPAIHLEMSTGNNPKPGGDPVRSSLGEQAVLDLWDKIASSIRVRPATVEAIEAPMATGSPLGLLASAGAPCPESGWWICGDGGAGDKVLGGPRQYFRKGQRMPQALLLPPQTLWERVRGVQPSYESKDLTVWKMVDKRSRARLPPAVALDQARVGTPATPTAVSGPSVVEGPAVATYAVTNAPCPASGWWHCEEINALDGTRWFAKGSLLPSVTFVLPRGADKVPGLPKGIYRRATWRLMRRAQAPESAPGIGNTDGEPSCGDL